MLIPNPFKRSKIINNNIDNNTLKFLVMNYMNYELDELEW